MPPRDNPDVRAREHRSGLGRALDRVLRRERRNPGLVLSQLEEHLESTLAADEVLPSVVETVAQSLDLPYAALELRPLSVDDPGERVESRPGGVSDREERLPLLYRGETVGELTLGLPAGEDLTATDRRLLEDLARQAGIAAHAVALTRALQRSRERLVAAREEERRRLRRDLHDGLGPTLAAVTLGLDAARAHVRQDPDRAETALLDLRRQTQAAIDDIRRLVYGLRPPSLDELGLVGALREQADRMNGSPRVTVDAPATLPPLPAAVEVAALRIALEAVTNAVRHARASQCTVRITADSLLELTVSDDGDGEPEAFHTGVGIASMRERAEELGGTCVIERARPSGTTVLARLPLTLP